VSEERRPPLPPGPYLVVGLARSGVAAARMLAGRDEVIGCDVGEPGEAAALEGVEVHLRSEGVELLDRAHTVVKSPGVPREVPVVQAALDRGLEVTGELELAWRLIPNRFLAVTGTNGKTTTAELLGAIHRAAGLPVAVAGNVGTPLASLAGALDPAAVVVCEASSFQLEDSSAFAPECAVLLNIEPDHLDRHADFARYRDAKLRIFENQGPQDIALRPPFSWPEELDMARSEVRLRGAHNLENAMAAATAALATGVPPDAVATALREFPGVPHRLEEVAEVGGVLYVNDSKATNVASAAGGIEAFEGGVHAILGGSLKGGGFEGLRGPASERCRACYLIGAAAERLERDLEGTVPLVRCGDLERAVGAAADAAEAGEVVLLSPACASYDQYRDFEERGDHFRALVLARA
jgi:UDP-N-acetylmuramoylalanine--D-glutamate ligase